jgi:alpha-beta hydrolase superfamily lysophospholipase
MHRYAPLVPAVDPAQSGGGLDWRLDRLLGEPFQEASVGEATLVRSVASPPGARAAFLHVHGYNDYFFQDHLARAVVDAGYAFYAVDLRHAGRSLRPDVIPHFVTDLGDYHPDLDAAVHAVRALEPGLPLVVHAHSTGGLTTSLWAHARRSEPSLAPDVLVLNSPFLDLAGAWPWRSVSARLVEVLGRRRPLAVLSTSASMYATYQLRTNGGRWSFDTTLKRPEGVPARAGWLRAVLHGQAALAGGLAIACPVLLARSATSGRDSADNPLLDAQDTILDVARMARRAPLLGDRVDQLVVDGAVHDLALSADGPRTAYLRGMLSWTDSKLTLSASRQTPETA